MITGVHTMFYSSQPDELRAFLRVLLQAHNLKRVRRARFGERRFGAEGARTQIPVKRVAHRRPRPAPGSPSSQGR